MGAPVELLAAGDAKISLQTPPFRAASQSGSMFLESLGTEDETGKDHRPTNRHEFGWLLMG